MKLIAIGDIHGRKIWKNIVEKEVDADMIIFMGDYFDSHDTSNGLEEIANFTDILEFKKANPDKVILLTGNHDYHYIRGADEKYSGYQKLHAMAIGELVENAINEDLMQMCYLHNEYFFSHAGLTITWYNNLFNSKNIAPVIDNSLVDIINDFLKFRPAVFQFAMGPNLSKSGNDVTQSPIWVRPQSLVKDAVDNITYVVGHTSVQELAIKPQGFNLILTDCLGYSGEYLIIENNEAKIGI